MRFRVPSCGGGGRVRWSVAGSGCVGLGFRGRLFGGFRAAGWGMAEFLWRLNRVCGSLRAVLERQSMIRGVGSGSGDHRAIGGLLVLGLLAIGVVC